MEKITVDKIMAKESCAGWTREQIEKHIGTGKTLLEILDLDIDHVDRIWAVTRFLPDKINRAFAIWSARQCKTNVKGVTDYIDVIERYYANDATEEESDAADITAYGAAGWATFWAAVENAHVAAHGASGWATYWAADRAEMQQRQINKLKQMISEGDNANDL